MAKKRGNNEGSITRRKDGLWQAMLTVGRDPKNGKLKRAYFYGKTRKEVDYKLTKAKHDNSRGTFVARHKVTVGEWLDTWLWEYKKPGLRPITFDSYEMIIRRHLKPELGNISLLDLRPEYVQQYHNGKSREGLAASTIRLHHVILSDALKQAEKNSLVMRNVCRLVETPRRVDCEPVSLQEREVVLGKVEVGRAKRRHWSKRTQQGS